MRSTSTRYEGVKSFLPKGRTAATIYTVKLIEKPYLTKVGRSMKWMSRRRAYDYWNLAPGDGVEDYRTFTFNEEYVDLPAIEAMILHQLPFPVWPKTKEWFHAPIEEVGPAVEQIIETLGLSYS